MSQHPIPAPISVGSRDGEASYAYQQFQQLASQNATQTTNSIPMTTQATSASNAQPPNVDLQVLAGLPAEQIAAIGRLFLSGAIHLPQAVNAQAPQASHFAAATQNGLPRTTVLEDGELEDGELSDSTDEHHTRKVPSQQAASNSAFTPSYPVSSKRGSTVAELSGPPAKRLQSAADMTNKLAQLSNFIRIMNESGYGFTQIKEYVTDKHQLQVLYDSLSLTSDSTRNVSPFDDVNDTKSPPATAQSAASIPAQLSSSARQATSKTDPAKDRSAYLARLQAAKNKKTNSSPLNSAQINGAASVQHNKAPSSTTNQRRNVDPEKNKLLRERLAALQAQQAQKEQQAKSIENGALHTNRSLGAGLSSIPAIASSKALPATSASAITIDPSIRQKKASNAMRHKPFDINAMHPDQQQLVIDISEEDASDFDSDVDSDADDDEGVSLPILEQQASRLLDQSQAGLLSSGPVTPATLNTNVNAYEKKLQEIEQAKQRLAALQAKAKTRTESKTLSTNTSADASLESSVDSADDGRVSISATPEGEDVLDTPSEPHIPQHGDDHSTAHLPGLASFRGDDAAVDLTQAADVDMADDEGAADDDDFDSIYQSTNEINPAVVQEQTTAGDLDLDLGLDTDDSNDTDPDHVVAPAEEVDEVVSEDDDDSSDFYETDDKMIAGQPEADDMPIIEVDTEVSDDDDASSMDISESESEESQLEEKQKSADGDGDVVDNRTVSDQAASSSMILQPTHQESRHTEQGQTDAPDVDSDIIATASRFAPYESPLSMLKDYRFNPDFTGSVKGGYKSMTFSHKIDPNIPFCPYEIQDGQCKRADCQFQHFADIQLTESEVLHQLVSSKAGSRDPEEEEAWQSGLQTILNEMRQLGSKLDIDTIAARLVDYRQSFDRRTALSN